MSGEHVEPSDRTTYLLSQSRQFANQWGGINDYHQRKLLAIVFLGRSLWLQLIVTSPCTWSLLYTRVMTIQYFKVIFNITPSCNFPCSFVDPVKKEGGSSLHFNIRELKGKRLVILMFVGFVLFCFSFFIWYDQVLHPKYPKLLLSDSQT